MRLPEVLLCEVSDLRSPAGKSSRPRALSVVAYVAGDYAGERCVGAGAVTLPSGAQSPWNAPAVASAMEGAARALVDAGLPLDAPDSMALVRDVVGRWTRSVADHAVERWQRTGVSCVGAALEAALLDLLARVQGNGLVEMIGALRPTPSRSAQTLQVSAGVEDIGRMTAAQSERLSVTRLATSGRVQHDVAALEAAAQANSEAGRGDRPLWLECSGRYQPDAAEWLVAEVGGMIADGRLPRGVYVEQPLPRSQRDEMAACIRQAQELTTSHGLAGSGRDLRIVLDESVQSPADVGYFLRNGGVQAVSVDPGEGVDNAVQIVEHALAAVPDVTVIVAGMGQRTDLGAAAVEATARMLPKLDFYLPGRPAIRLMRYGDDEIDRGWTADHAPSTGLGPAPSLPRIVAAMGRGIWERVDRAALSSGLAAYGEYETFGLENLGKNSLDSYLLEKEVRRLGLTTVRFRSVDFHAEDAGGRTVGFHCTTGPSTSRYVGKVCGDKQVTRVLMTRAGVSVPDGGLVSSGDWRRAQDLAGALGWPVVVKPHNGKGGRGVTTNIRDEETLERAFTGLARAGHDWMIVEEHVAGADFRFLVVGDRVVSVLSRTAGGVVGDGLSTVAELMLTKNLARLRNPHLRTRLLRLGDEAMRLLAEHGATPDSVPDKGERIPLAMAANLSQGGDSVEVLADTHPSLLDMAVRAVRAVPGLQHAGIDVLAENHRRPLDDQRAAICELNSLPATASHHYPAVGPARNVSRSLVQHYVDAHGLTTGELADTGTVTVRVRVTGTVQGVGYRRRLANHAGQLGLSGWVRHGDAPGVVEAEVTGSLDLVSVLAAQAGFGPPGSQPQLVETSVIAERHTGDFHIVPG